MTFPCGSTKAARTPAAAEPLAASAVQPLGRDRQRIGRGGFGKRHSSRSFCGPDPLDLDRSLARRRLQSPRRSLAPSRQAIDCASCEALRGLVIGARVRAAAARRRNARDRPR